MADIFLSYNENDRDTVRRLAATLEAVGWSVWSDRRIPAGGTWRNLLQRELASMRCMVVVWSAHSVKSEWVCEEATEGRQLGCLVPVCIERVKPPAGFREIQAADLVGWDGSARFGGMQTLIDDIRQRIGTPSTATIVPPPVLSDEPDPSITLSRRREWVLVGGPIAALVAIALFIGPLRPDAIPSADSAKESTPPAGVVAQPVPAKRTDPGVADPSAPPQKATPVVLIANPASAANQSRPQATRPATASAPKRARCADLTERVSLGETLTNDAQSFLEDQCGG